LNISLDELEIVFLLDALCKPAAPAPHLQHSFIHVIDSEATFIYSVFSTLIEDTVLKIEVLKDWDDRDWTVVVEE
jgi:hypothetical protein